MDEQRLRESIENELLELLIAADRPEAKANFDTETSHPKAMKAIGWKALEVIIYIAAAPIMIFSVVVMAAVWALIFVIENSIRLVVAKIKGRMFKVVWPDLGGSASTAATIGSLKVVIFTNDHPPPHFHVLTDMYNAKFDIETCESLGGELPGKHLKAIRKWHAKNIDALRVKWMETRPGDVNG